MYKHGTKTLNDKLSQEDYFEIHAQFDVTPSVADSVGATGEHQILRYMLTKLGYSVPSYRGAEIEVASQLLSIGYEYD